MLKVEKLFNYYKTIYIFFFFQIKFAEKYFNSKNLVLNKLYQS